MARKQRTLGSFLAEQRERRKMSLREAAAACGVSHVTLYMLEAGRQRPTLQTLYAIAGGYGLDPIDLVARSYARPSP